MAYLPAASGHYTNLGRRVFAGASCARQIRNLQLVSSRPRQEEQDLPFTISHVAAVLPLKKASPRFFSFPALVVGSMSPDFAYMLHSYGYAGLSHSLLGIVVFCAPLSAVLLAAL